MRRATEADAAGDGDAVQLRHFDIQKDEVVIGTVLLQKRVWVQKYVRFGGDQRLFTVAADILLQPLRLGDFILYDGYSYHCSSLTLYPAAPR